MLERVLYGIEKPGRYIGGEKNACRKSFQSAGVRFALAFPDVYEVGLSHLGLRLLYHTLNGVPDVMADRVYAPWFDFEARLRAVGEPLRGLESERPLEEFDFVGFSLQYELSYTNILTILDLGRIPLRAADRDLRHPWVIAGGPCAFNPEPLAEFFDFIVLGEAEQVLQEIIQIFRDWQRTCHSRQDFLQQLRHVAGVYVPQLFRVAYHPSGEIAAIEPRFADYRGVTKRVVADLDRDAPVPSHPLVPVLEIVHNRLGMEIARGCTRGCRFCQASFIYRPVRERYPAAVLQAAEAALANSGFEELSLLSLSTGDYCQIQSLLTSLMDRFAARKVAVSFPSMRVGTLTADLMQLVKEVRKTGFTLAPEAGSERLRRVINKGILDQDLLSAVGNAFQLGWQVLKLYFMMGLPTETAADLDALVALCRQVWQVGKPQRAAVNVAVSTFVPKPHTPFQWAPQLPRRLVEEQLRELGQRLKRPGLRFKWHHPGQSELEAVFARGDRRLGKVLLRAWELGARFDGWTELLREEVWQQAFREYDLAPSFYARRERARTEILPWDHLSAGVHKDFLWHEYERAVQEQFTPDCRWDACTKCGVCDHKSLRPLLHAAPEPGAVAEIRSKPAAADSVTHFLYWMRYSQRGRVRFFGHLEIAQSFARAVRRSKLPAAYSQGFHPHIKLSFQEALPLGLESQTEEAHLTLTEKLPPGSVQSLLNCQLPEGLHIEEIARVPKRVSRPECRRVTYHITHLGPGEMAALVRNWRKRLNETLVKKTKKREVRTRLGDLLLDLSPLSKSSLMMDLYEGPQVCIRPPVVLQHLLQADVAPGGTALPSGETAANSDVANQELPVNSAGGDGMRLAGCRILKVAVSRFVELEGSENVCRAHHQR